MSTVLDWLLYYKYFAMFGILFLCGFGLPIPEEVTLVGSGLLVGWREANFFIASLACVLGILMGDLIIFGLGYHYGENFLRSRLMRFFLPHGRQKRVAGFFGKHGAKAVFFARFFAVLRIGVYAYAGSQRMSVLKFLFLDLLGALISGPTSILLGSIVGRKIIPIDENAREQAAGQAYERVKQFGHWLLLAIVAAIVLYVVFHIWMNRRARAADRTGHNGDGLPPPSAAHGPAGGAVPPPAEGPEPGTISEISGLPAGKPGR
jgi:membrane protein DedA with SNARE-associated domain